MDKGYTYNSSGTNDQVRSLVLKTLDLDGAFAVDSPSMPQGNHYCSRDYGSSGSGYHYSNS